MAGAPAPFRRLNNPFRVARIMPSRAATFPDVTAYNARAIAARNYRRAALGGAVLGLGSASVVALMAGTATVAAAWLVAGSLAGNPALRGSAPFALETAGLPRPPRRLAEPADTFGAALASANPIYASNLTHEDRLASIAPAVSPPAAAPAAAPPLPPQRSAALTESVPLPPPRPLRLAQIEPKPEIARASAVAAPPPVRIESRAAPPEVAVPRMRPAPLETQHKPQVAAAVLAPVVPSAPPATTGSIEMPAKRAAPQLAYNNPETPPAADGHTAIYDIVAHTVYLPDGERLEAHSGLGRMLDDPRYVSTKGRGATPPNVYNLTLRGGLFHGVQAIRLNPVADSKMFGRDGILAHTYMLGPSGQSFGCVSFKNYPEFLHAFLRGEINRMVVVPHLQDEPWATRARRADGRRYAFDIESAH